jgi:CDP-diacylglycerol---serine O-phosphatidyltransferase
MRTDTETPSTVDESVVNLHPRIDWLPDAVTSVGLVLGCLSLVSAFDGHFERSAILIDASLICDVLDGLVARVSHAAAPFGAELDSLSDVVAFGVAPAGLVYSWALKPLGLWGVLIIGPFVISAALRLARFNVEATSGRGSKMRFVGLPVPGAAAAIAGLMLASGYLHVPIRAVCGFMAVVTLILSGLMVSRLPYPAMKINSLQDYGWRLVAVPVGAAILLLLVPRLFLSVAPILYVLAGPTIAIRDHWRSERGPVATSATI